VSRINHCLRWLGTHFAWFIVAGVKKRREKERVKNRDQRGAAQRNATQLPAVRLKINRKRAQDFAFQSLPSLLVYAAKCLCLFNLRKLIKH